MAVAARSLDLAQLARASTSARVFARGEAYFAEGAVLEAQEVGPGIAKARVRGSSDEPYAVELRFGDGALVARCSCPFDFEPICKHAVAACLALSAPLMPAPTRTSERAIAEALERERASRQKSASSDGFDIVARPGRARPHFVVRSERTGASYDVFLSAEVAFCSCTDFLTSELPECKHIGFLRERAAPKPLSHPVVFVAPADTAGRLHEPLRDVRAVFPAGQPPTPLRGVLDEQGRVDPSRRALAKLPPEKAAARIARLLDGLPPGSVVRPEVSALLSRLQADAKRAARFDAFERQVREHLARRGPAPHAWQRAIGSMSVSLHPYQVDGVLFAARAGRALIADDMGLGKTMQALAASRLLHELGECKRTLVVCPASLKHQWAKEASRAFGDTFPATVVDGGRQARRALYADRSRPLLIVNYELFIRDIREAGAAGFDLVVLDEAQRIKNWSTRTAKTVKSLRTRFAFVLTGTPLENRLSELHSIVEYLDPRALGPAWRLVPEFGDAGDDGRLRGFHGLELVRKRLQPLMVRRERSLVLSQLPARSEKTYLVPFTRAQKGPHDDHVAEAGRILAKKHLTEADVLRVMAHLTNARMIANGLSLYEFSKVEDEARRMRLSERTLRAFPSPKLFEFAQVLQDLLEDRQQKIVVFSQWERMLRLAAAASRDVLESAGVRPLFFHGSLTSRERAEVVSDFHEDARARVFFSTDAGGVGLNLQEAASVVVHLEVPWNPAVLEQRVGRVHRMGQKRPVQVVQLISEGSIEERIAATVRHKRELFDGLFRGSSDEVRFGDGSGEGLRERLRQIVASPSLGDLRRPVDGKVFVPPLPAEEAPEPPPPPTAEPAPAPPSLPAPVGAGFDAAPLLKGLLTALAPAAASLVPERLLVSIRREGAKVSIELEPPSADFWRNVAAFAHSAASAR